MFLCIYIKDISIRIMLYIMYSARFVKQEPYLQELQYDECCNPKFIQRSIVKLWKTLTKNIKDNLLIIDSTFYDHSVNVN